MNTTPPPPLVRQLGIAEYNSVWARMREFTDQRDAQTPDELWVVEHPPVYTLGQAGKLEHILDAGQIPVANSDRGGQVTYHGPGQIVIYTLVDIRRAKLGIRDMVMLLENSIIDLLAQHGISAEGMRDAPGVYVDKKKIAALGLRVRRGCTYHGLSLNASMDLGPFTGINPCGYAGLQVTSTTKLGVNVEDTELAQQLVLSLLERLSQQFH